jgi:hypothetical protein
VGSPVIVAKRQKDTTPLNRDGGASTPIPRAHAASQPVPPIDVSQSFINRVLSAVQLYALLRVACLILPSSFFSCSIASLVLLLQAGIGITLTYNIL